MSPLTATDTRPDAGRALALALGVVRSTPVPVRLPSVTQQIVPGRSPLEASGWADTADVDRVLVHR